MKRWKSGFYPVTAVFFGTFPFLGYVYYTVWEFWKSCPLGSVFAVFLPEMGNRYFFHRISTEVSGGIFQKRNQTKMTDCRKMNFSKKRTQLIFHHPKRDVQKEIFKGFGKYPQKLPWKIITFPQGNPHVVEKCLSDGGKRRRPFCQLPI